MTSGFHWFVAWRYLMARPRRVSVTILAVVGTLLIASIFSSVTAKLVLSKELSHNLISGWAYRNALIGAAGLATIGLFGLFVGMVRTALADPLRIDLPIATALGLFLLAVGAASIGNGDRTTHVVGTALLVLGGPVFVAAVGMYVARTRGDAASPVVFCLLLVASAAALVEVARFGLRPPTPLSLSYRPDRLFLPSAGLLVLGVMTAFPVLMRRALNRALASVSLILIVASVVYVRAATSMMDDAAMLQAEPTGARYLEYVRYGGIGLAAFGAVLTMMIPVERWERLPVSRSNVTVFVLAVLGQVFTRVFKILVLSGHSSARMRGWHRFMMHVAVICLFGGGLLVLLSVFVTAPPPMRFIPLGEKPAYTAFSVAATILIALAELAIVLGVIRYFFTFFTAVSVAGVTIGSMALVIVLSVMSGFETDLRKKILGSNAHVLISKVEGKFTETDEVTEIVGAVPGVVGHTPFLLSEVVIAANSNYSNVIIKGIDPETVGQVTDLDDNVEQPRALERLWPLAPDGGILGPPRDAGTAEPGTDAGAAEADAGATDAGAADGADAMDPAPRDLIIDFDMPEDFGEEYRPPPPDAGLVDRAPSDLDVDFDAPEDFGEGYQPPRDAGADQPAVADRPAGDGGLADLPFRFEPEFGPVADRVDGIASLDRLDLDPPPPPVAPRVAALPGVLAGRELVRHLHLYVGQEVRIVSPLAKNTPAGPVPRTRFMRVGGSFFTEMYEYDLKFVYVPLPTLQAFLDMYDEISGIEVRVRDPDDTGGVVRRLRRALAKPATQADVDAVVAAMRDRSDGPWLAHTMNVLRTLDERTRPVYLVQDWKEINRNLFAALKLEKIAMFLVLVIIILVASFSIVTNLIMVVVEKAREIALLKTLGASDRSILRVFIAQGSIIGLCGTLVGVLHGLIACGMLEQFGFPLNPEVYYIDKLPVDVEWTAVFLVLGAGVLISVIATLYPAAVGARMHPIEGLRY